MNYRIGVTGPTIIVNTRTGKDAQESQFTEEEATHRHRNKGMIFEFWECSV